VPRVLFGVYSPLELEQQLLWQIMSGSLPELM
jgi:hypothetical protein